MDESKDNLANLGNALYAKLGEAVELAEEVQRVAPGKQELRQARRITKQLTDLRGNAIELQRSLEDRGAV
jgi:hypothetical protein